MTEPSSASSSTPALASASASLGIHAVALKLPKFWADKAGMVCSNRSSVCCQRTYLQPQVVLLVCCCSGTFRRSSGSRPHLVPPGRVAHRVPQQMPHRSPHPQPFPKVSSFHVTHLGHRGETLHLDGEDVLPAPIEPLSAQG